MSAQDDSRNPFAGVDIAGLDVAFFSHLARAAAADDGARAGHQKESGLSTREKYLFRFGVLVGLGEWSLAEDAIAALLDGGAFSASDVERAVAEAGVVRGWPACAHLGPALESRGLHGPTRVADALARVRASRNIASTPCEDSEKRFTEREVFALGLGITWGARCWDT